MKSLSKMPSAPPLKPNAHTALSSIRVFRSYLSVLRSTVPIAHSQSSSPSTYRNMSNRWLAQFSRPEPDTALTSSTFPTAPAATSSRTAT